MKDVFSAIPIFVAVVESGSFSLASERLGMTKSAVSKRISSLEDSLGTRLFHRSTRKLTLTESGEEFSDYARNSVYIAQQGITAATLNQGSPKGTLKINAPMTFSRLHLAPHLKEFLDLYPDIKIILSMDDKVVDMIEGAYDVGIRIGELKDSSLIARQLAKCKSVVCAAPEYLQRAGTPNTPHDLKDHNCIYYSLFQAGVEWTFLKAGKKLKVEPTGNFIVNNSDVICEMLLQGLGICQMPTFIVQRYLNTGQLVQVLANYDLPDHSIFAVYPERRHMPEKVKVFIDFIEKKLHSVYWEVESEKSA
ncbi:LysR family transcriptional regulator [Pseudoalteromonas sp. R3]|uniref:LysR family transcriptional regulator n=1 Tax=Pseudoalteromonas sp. R3 TaxID=1709477 RepID=UPI0006B44B25|nr:LysR family transcriptional regulator [Pseudoalteromonas sp. R3]AZZ96199.1 LysR family transcriptional regulator [Pseudoalteromonas sp. R3]